MKFTIDTETDSLEDLQSILFIISNSIGKKGGNVKQQPTQQSIQQPVQQTTIQPKIKEEEPIKNPNMGNPYVKRLSEQENLMKTVDLSHISRSDYGLMKRRQNALRR